jgi:hypothetical protein
MLVDDGAKKLIFLSEQLAELLAANNNMENDDTYHLRCEIDRLEKARQFAKSNVVKFFN